MSPDPAFLAPVTAGPMRRADPILPTPMIPPPTAPTAEPQRREKRRKILMIALIAALVLALVGGGIALAVSRMNANRQAAGPAGATSQSPAASQTPTDAAHSGGPSGPPASAVAAAPVAPINSTPSEKWSATMSDVLPAGHQATSWVASSSMLVVASTGKDGFAFTGLKLADGKKAWQMTPFSDARAGSGKASLRCAPAPTGEVWLCAWVGLTSKSELAVRPALINLADGNATQLPVQKVAVQGAKWSVAADTNGALAFVLVAAPQGSLTAFTPEGTQAWTEQVASQGAGSLTVDPGLMTLVGSDSTQVLDPMSGKVYGTFTSTGADGTPAATPLGNSLLLTPATEAGGKLTAVGLDGKDAWTAPAGESAVCSIDGSRVPALMSICSRPDVPVVISRHDTGSATSNGEFWVLDAKTGQKLWQLPGIAGDLIAMNASTLLFRDHSTYAIYDLRSGKQITTAFGDLVNDYVVSDDVNYYIVYKGRMYATGAKNGKEKWSVSVPGWDTSASLGQALSRAGSGLIVTDDVTAFTRVQYWG